MWNYYRICLFVNKLRILHIWVVTKYQIMVTSNYVNSDFYSWQFLNTERRNVLTNLGAFGYISIYR